MTPNKHYNSYKEDLDLEFLREYWEEYVEERTFERSKTRKRIRCNALRAIKASIGQAAVSCIP